MSRNKWYSRRTTFKKSIDPFSLKGLRDFKKRKKSQYSAEQMYHFAMEAVLSNNAGIYECLLKNGLDKSDYFPLFGKWKELYPEQQINRDEIMYYTLYRAAIIMNHYPMLEIMAKNNLLFYSPRSFREFPWFLTRQFKENKTNFVKAITKYRHVDEQLLLCSPTLLSMAAAAGNKKLVNELIAMGANVNGHPWEPDEYIQFALYYSTEDMNGVFPQIIYSHLLTDEEKIDMFEFMYSLGADPGGFTWYLPRPYQEAAKISPILLDWFVKKGENITAQGYEAQFDAVYADNAAVINYLVENNLIVDTQNYEGKTVLELAALYQHSKSFALLFPHCKKHDVNHYLQLAHREDIRNFTEEDKQKWYVKQQLDCIELMLSLGASEKFLEELNRKKYEKEMQRKLEREKLENDEPTLHVVFSR